MATEKNNQHLSPKDLADCYYEIPVAAEIRLHLESCAVCQRAYTDIQTHTDLIVADYERQAMEGLDPYFFARETQAIMARVRAPQAVVSFLITRWQWFAATTAILVVSGVALNLYTGQRQYSRLWEEAQAVRAEVGPVSTSPGEFTTVFDDSTSNPGFPIGPDAQESAGSFGND